MMAKDGYPEQDNCISVKLLTQSMHSEHFHNFDRKITKSSIFSMEILCIFLLNRNA